MKRKNILAFLLALLMVAACISTGISARADGDSDIQYAPRDIVFVIDNSGSMKQTDPNQICLSTIQAGIDYMDYGDQVGVVAYSLDAENSFNLRDIKDENDKTEVKKFAENSLTRDGQYTDISSGLFAAATMLEERGQENHGKSIILISDGENDVKGSGRTDEEIQKKLDEAIAKGYEVNIIGINAQNNESYKKYLEEIASKSGGEARFPENAEKAKEDIAYFVANTRGEEFPVNSDIPIHIPGMTFQATIWVQYQDQLEIILKDPKGVEMKEGADFTLSQSNGNFIIKVLQPDEGDWTLFLKAPKEGTARLFQSIQNPDVKVTATVDKTSDTTGDISGILSFEADQNGTMVTTTIDNLSEYPKLSAVAKYTVDGGAEQTADMSINGNRFVVSLDQLQGNSSFIVEVNANGYIIASEKVDAAFVQATTTAPATQAPTTQATTQAPTTQATTQAPTTPAKKANPAAIAGGIAGLLAVIGAAIFFINKSNQANLRGPQGQIVICIENDKDPKKTSFNKTSRPNVNLYESIMESIEKMQDENNKNALRSEVVKLQADLKKQKIMLEKDQAADARRSTAARTPSRTAGTAANKGPSRPSARPGSASSTGAAASGRPAGVPGRTTQRSNSNARWVLSKSGKKYGLTTEQRVFERPHGVQKTRGDSSISKITIRFNQS